MASRKTAKQYARVLGPQSTGEINRTLRKKGGIFYTPPDICDLVTRNTITAYILDQIGISWPLNADPPIFSLAFSQASKNQQELATRAIKGVKILDPACGEGALLEAACNVLFEFSQQLLFREDADNINLKANIVADNIYGVDLLEENVRSTQLALARWICGSNDKETGRFAQPMVEQHVRRGNSLLGWSGDDVDLDITIQKLLPFPWASEFPSIMNAGGFDIIVANPPYGNLLTNEETLFLKDFETLHTREIAAVFLERFFQLSRKEAQLGLIIANSIAINASTAPARTIIRRHMSGCRMALFGTRPGRLFPDAEIRAMLLFGKKDDPQIRGDPGLIFTTNARKFFQRERSSILKDLQYENTAGIELGHHSIGEGFPEIALPKVGSPMIRQILLHLKKYNQVTVRDRINQPGFQEPFEIRTTGGYWLTALWEFPYRSSKIRQIYTSNPLERDFLILLANSALFYLFWSTYGNLRDLKIADFSRLPFPPSEILLPKVRTIQDLCQQLNSCLLQTFEPASGRGGGRRGEFHPGRCKAIIDPVDDLICTIYGFSSEESTAIKTTDAHLRRET